jgi:hypothetical protein
MKRASGDLRERVRNGLPTAVLELADFAEAATSTGDRVSVSAIADRRRFEAARIAI